MPARVPLLAAVFAALLAAPAAASADTVAVRSGALTATLTDAPFSVAFSGSADLATIPGGTARSLRRDGSAAVATLADGSTLRAEPAGDGVIALHLSASSISFGSASGERFLGFGERSNAVDQRGGTVQNYVADGAYPPSDRAFTQGVVPPWGFSGRDDATNYPIPWLLSTRGYGVLIDNDETSTFTLGSTWRAAVEGAPLSLRVFGGPTPAVALARFTKATGRQPAPNAPWDFGPWFQTGQSNTVPLETEAAAVKALRDADAPVSVAETQLHYLPCGAHHGNEDYEAQRDAAFHAAGLAHLTYVNPLLCASYSPVFENATQAGALQTAAGGAPFLFNGFVGGTGPAGFTVQPLAQFDFTAPSTAGLYRGLVAEAVDAGHDGWMEDFGEYTSPDAGSADGTPGSRMHNRYPTTYHCALQKIAAAESARTGRPLTRFSRSGWTGTARCTDDVWGGDPTTTWGYDGLRSALYEGLTMGLSGVSRWGSDIGGYDSFGPDEQLTPELLARWVELGAVSGLMRTKGGGLAIPSYQRPQVWEPATLPIWKRYAKLRTQLLPYLQAADRQYRATGLPLMRHLALTNPGDPAAARVDDELGFGDAFLAAPVLTDKARERKAYLPEGRWVDWWRSVRYDPRSGAFSLRKARVLKGRRTVTLPAPLDELPLLARAGSLLAMLPADVDTLASYGKAPGLVHLGDRRDAMTLLAFPRGRTTAAFGSAGERFSSTEGRRSWRLRINGARVRTWTIQASLKTLAHPFRPRRVLGAKHWRYDRQTGVLTATVRAKTATIRAVR